MIIAPEIQRRFAQSKPFIEFVARFVQDIVRPYCDDRGYAFLGRAKTQDSLAEKIESGRFRRWSEIEDLYACTIVVPTLLEEPDALAFLESNFEKLDVKGRKYSKKAPDVFRFEATRFIGRLRALPGQDRAPEIASLRFEVQVRTAFEHAWSVTTHALTYKSQVVDWKRERLAAQMKAVLEQLDTLILAFEHAAPHVAESEWSIITLRKRIADGFQGYIQRGLLPPELNPKDWSRFSLNLYELLHASVRTASRQGGPHRRLPPEDVQMRDAVEKALQVIERELSSGEVLRNTRSLSLFQLVIGLLISNECVGLDLGKFTVNVTNELVTLFPRVAQLRNCFDYDS